MADATNEPVLVASDHITNYFKRAAPLLAPNQRVKITAAVMELLRLTSAAAAVAGDDPRVARICLIDLVGQLCGVEWEKIPFSITKHALAASAPPPDEMFDALRTFANLVETDATLGTEEVFRSLFTVAERPAAPPTEPKRAPKVVANGDLARVFARSPKFEPDGGTPPLALLNWQSELPSGLGPQLWALCLEETPTQAKLLLETGETHWVSTETFLLAKTTDKQDYQAAPLSLLANARAFLPWHFLTDPIIPDEEWDRRIGQFTKPVSLCPYGLFAVAALQAVFDNPATCPPDNSVSTSLSVVSVDGTPYFVTLDARTSSGGAYVTAKLLDAAENVIMRLDTPRQFSPEGTYLFPLKDQVVGLVIR